MILNVDILWMMIALVLAVLRWIFCHIISCAVAVSEADNIRPARAGCCSDCIVQEENHVERREIFVAPIHLVECSQGVRVWGPVRPPALNSSVKSLQYAV
jgi:hypothetical protein